MLKRKILHFLKNPTMMTFQLPDTVEIFLTDFKNLMVEVLFYGSDLKDEVAVLCPNFSYFDVGIPLLRLVLRLHFKDLLL